jgi:hypothetical protein
MRSHDNGSLSAATQVKVLSPEIDNIALGQGFHILETNTGIDGKGDVYFSVPGSKSAAGKRIDFTGTWESQCVPERRKRGAEEVTKISHGALAVGQTHSRGVGGVMPIEPNDKALEGVCNLTQRGWL